MNDGKRLVHARERAEKQTTAIDSIHTNHVRREIDREKKRHEDLYFSDDNVRLNQFITDFN